MDTVPFILTSPRKVSDTNSFEVTDHNENHLYNVSLIHVDDIDQICKDANQGFKSWSSLDVTTKISFLKLFRTNIRNIKEDLVSACLEIGIPQWFVDFNYSLSLNMIDDAIYNIATLDEGSIPGSYLPNQLSIILRQPIGPVLSISPWNAPIILTMRSILSPLLAGCSVLVKSSELSSRISYLICDAFIKSGAPDGTLQLIHCSTQNVADVVKLTIANDHIRMVNFTGSTLIGKIISKISGEFLKPCLLELGGKNSFIISDDVADLEKALNTTLFSSWAHNGQICMCSDRLYIHESLYEESLSKLVTLAKNLIDDDQRLNQRNQLQSLKIKKLIDDAISKNARVLYKGLTDIQHHENFINPIILTNVTSDMEISTTETFGPVLTVSKFSDIKQLIEELNEEPHGLKTSFWSANHLKLIEILKSIQSGGVHINNSTINDETWLPHGGVKNSGNGRFNGRWGIESFSYLKTITLNES